ncbi:MBL fold hydrolase [Marinithermofilum abyssi]|uniref:MBL fold hydrolase n=1 Tax=Marinithermofilum abyssi TaxID=1571185 RepID=A0A8J2YD94_9BACL|nr:MBL fold metallo-hydrolase [Marinithermofilum abyssi]GGE08055.1 MBL fold hydrolase [Marinithermofilum abyssi]
MGKLQINTETYDGVTRFSMRYRMLGNNFHVSLYYVDGLLMETGPVRARHMVEQFVADHPVDRIALTHFHEDHSGNAAHLNARFGIPVTAGPETAALLKNPDPIPRYRQWIWGQMEAVSCTVSDVIETSRHRFRRIFTPGHSPDHSIWLEENQGWAFTGDLYLGTRLTYGMRGESVSQLIQSIRTLLSFPVATVFCSHAGIIREGRKGLQKKHDFLTWLTEETLDLHQQGAPSKEIAHRLLQRRPAVEWFSGGEMSPVHLIRSIVSEHSGVGS